MAATPGYSTREIRKAWRRFRHRFWWVLGLFACYVVTLFVAAAWFDRILRRWIDPGLVMAFFLGAGVATAVSMVVVLMGMDGARSHRDGREAEGWTAKVLMRLRRDGWTVVDDVEFKAENIDHVLLGPRGAIAVETKFTNDDWVLSAPAAGKTWLRGAWRRQLVGQAYREARKLRSLLRAGGVVTDVLPVLVLWGPNLGGVSTTVIGDVVVGLGRDPDAWVGQLHSTPLSTDELRLARAAVESLKAGKMVQKPRPAPTVAAVEASAGPPDTDSLLHRTDRPVPVAAGRT